MSISKEKRQRFVGCQGEGNPETNRSPTEQNSKKAKKRRNSVPHLRADKVRLTNEGGGGKKATKA